jgi:hypothetical protein
MMRARRWCRERGGAGVRGRAACRKWLGGRSQQRVTEPEVRIVETRSHASGATPATSAHESDKTKQSRTSSSPASIEMAGSMCDLAYEMYSASARASYGGTVFARSFGSWYSDTRCSASCRSESGVHLSSTR